MFTLGEAARICGGTLIAGKAAACVSGVSTDTRTIREGDLFFALRGPQFDGHAFVPLAFQKGAVAAVVGYGLSSDKPHLVVPDPLMAMQKLAAWYRSRFSIPVIGVTGSVGKTTTKECIAACLSQTFRVRTGFRNWNNHIGVPLNLFQLDPEDQCAVLELGANHKGEIAALCQIAQPTIGVITGIQPAHLEGFGSLEGIYRAKLELADYIEKSGSTLVVNGDDSELVSRVRNRNIPLITYGLNRRSDFFLSSFSVQGGFLCFGVNGVFTFRLQGYGSFNVLNALAAIAVASHFHMDLGELSESWCLLPSGESRFQVQYVETRDIQIVDDAYNANPEAFRHALDSFQEISKGRRKVVVCGEMLELGASGVSFHQQLGEALAASEIDAAIGVGPLTRETISAFKSICPNATAAHFSNREEALPYILETLKEGDSVLIKGSHGTGLWKLPGALS